jgi:hypothetical protein
MADEPRTRTISEVLPSRVGEVSALASADAPFIFFDQATSFGVVNGVAHVTLEALRHMHVGPEVRRDRVVTAHLRMSVAAATTLRAALDGIILMATPKPEGEPN